MPRSKRNRSLSIVSESRKRSRKSTTQEVILIDDSDDEDDLAAILAQIKQQEESERLAKELQGSWNDASGSKIPMLIDEDDEALAKRLAREWADEDEEIEISSIQPAAIGMPSSSNAASISSQPSLEIHKPQKASDHAQSPDRSLIAFRQLFTTTRACSKCGKDVPSPRGHVMFTGSDPLPPSLTSLLHAPCAACRTNHCRGCFTVIDCPPSCKGLAKNSACSVSRCCAEGRAIAIFETLGGFDRQYNGERATSDSRALATLSKKRATTTGTVGPGGTGYGTDSYGGYRGRGRGRNPSASAPRTSRVEKLAAHWEEILVRSMKILTELLPAPYSEMPEMYDMLPHASIGPLLSISQIPNLLASLLCNDSVTDWISRSETYHAMLSLLRRLADCELTIQVLIGQRHEMASSCGLETWMWEEGEITWRMESGVVETSAPLLDFFKKLTKQSEAFLNGASQMIAEGGEDGEVDDTIVNGTSLCGDIIAARDDMERAISIIGRPADQQASTSANQGPSASRSRHRRESEKGKGKETSVELARAYASACERLAFKHVFLAAEGKGKGTGLSYPNFNYSAQLNQSQNATRNPKDRLHLVKELAVTATSLPPGVWVRVDEVRNDVIKVMIAGPEGTPYAGGLFEFDCFMPLDYPNSPPLFHLRTTGGGTVRFNPNLYNCGKVCLSLLGTWPGRPEEQWSPKSTLLQVLVSIQSMILIDAPYFNEPGHGKANLNSSVSIEYNRNISLQTVRWAIVEWLKEEHRNGIWRDVIASHFSIQGSQIRQRIAEWASTNPAMRSYTASPNFPGRVYANYPAQHAPKQGGLDLVQEFEEGIERVDKWFFEGVE